MSNNCNAVITRGGWCHYCTLPFGHGPEHEHKALRWTDGDKGAEPASLASMPESFRREYEINSLRAENAALREALGSLQELLAKQIAVPRGDDLLCAACGLENDRHEDSCVVNIGLAIIEAALGKQPHAQGTSER